MTFSSPSFFWALGLLAIPIIIHLYNFRRYKIIYFSDVSLLKDIQMRSQTKNRLKHLLVLISRLLFLASLVLAFTEPRIVDQSTIATNQTNVSIYVDNSLSMQQEGGQGTLLTMATQRAFEIAKSFPNGTRFQLITNELSSNERYFEDIGGFTASLDKVAYSSIHQDLGKIVQFHKYSLAELPQSEGVLFAISDFQNTLDSTLIGLDSLCKIHLFPLEGILSSNISIDTLWISEPIIRPEQECQVHLKITNHGFESSTGMILTLFVEDQTMTTLGLDLKPSSTIDTLMSFEVPTGDFVNGSILVNDPSIPFDNTYFFTFKTIEKIKVVELNANYSNSPFKRLFDSPYFNYSQIDVNEIKLDSLANVELLILNNIQDINSGLSALIIEQISQSVNVLYVMPERLAESAKSFLNENFGIKALNWDTINLSVNKVDINNSLFKDVFSNHTEHFNFPECYSHWKLQGLHLTNVINIMDESPLLAEYRKQNGAFYLITCPLDNSYTNFQNHALFVPALLNMALSSGATQKISHTIGTRKIKLENNTPEGSRLVNEDFGVDFIPAVSFDGIIINDEISVAGHYHLESKDIAISEFSFNFSRRESRLQSGDEIITLINSIIPNAKTFKSDSELSTSLILQTEFGNELWPLFIIIALFSFLFESILIKVLFK